MKVADRVALGYGILLILMALLLGVQTYAFRRFREVNRKNSGDNLNYSLMAVDLVRDSDALEERTRKYLTRGDQDSKDEMKDFQQRFEDALREIREFRGSDREQAEAGRLDRFWREYLEAEAKAEPSSTTKNGPGGLTPDVADALSRLRTQSVTVYQALVNDIRNQGAESRKFSDRMEFIALWLGCASLAVGILIAYLIIRSIAGPLRNLSEGTRAFAEGKSFYRLDTSRMDEFSQIAKDFNSLAEKLRGPEDQADLKKYEL